MAKSVEDTHFYRYVRMFAANEVGSHPSHFGEPVEKFHEANADRQKSIPLTLLATSTHDTKISEDARARLFALAELPEEWELHLKQWKELNESALSQVAGRSAPDRNEEYLLYQILLASWPLRVKTADDDFRGRIKAYFHKALAEAKQNTTWSYPNKHWEESCERFVDRILRDTAFLEAFIPFAERIAHRGMLYSLAQTVLKLTSPGVPDIYQGNEIWDFSLVDPDNRRPVDFEQRRTLLLGLNQRSPGELLMNWHDGAIKMHVIRSILRLRREKPGLFTSGDYSPLTLTGKLAENVVAFTRQRDSGELLVVVPRRLDASRAPQLGDSWIGTRLNIQPGRWKNIFTGGVVNTDKPEVALPQVFAHWPVAVLLRI
jgi:(1->4)-alpha-D-glucan 1-alpha-D-glucosylmutase